MQRTIESLQAEFVAMREEKDDEAMQQAACGVVPESQDAKRLKIGKVGWYFCGAGPSVEARIRFQHFYVPELESGPYFRIRIQKAIEYWFGSNADQKHHGL